MSEIWNAFQRSRAAAGQEAQNAFVMGEQLRKLKQDREIKNILSGAFTPGADGQPGSFDMNKAISGLAAGGQGGKALELHQGQLAAQAPLQAIYLEHKLDMAKTKEEREYWGTMLENVMGGGKGMQPGSTFKLGPKGPEIGFDPTRAAEFRLKAADDARKAAMFQYETGMPLPGSAPAPRSAPMPSPTAPAAGVPMPGTGGGPVAGTPMPGVNTQTPGVPMSGAQREAQQLLSPKARQEVEKQRRLDEQSIKTATKKKIATLKAEDQTKSLLALQKGKADLDRVNVGFDNLLAHPGLESSFGMSSVMPVMPGGDRADFEGLLEQMENTMFLSAREGLKGGGSITDFEGKKAEASLLQAKRAQSPEAAKLALQDARYWLNEGYRLMQLAAEGNYNPDTVGERKPPSQLAREEAEAEKNRVYKPGDIVEKGGKRWLIKTLRPDGKPETFEEVR